MKITYPLLFVIFLFGCADLSIAPIKKQTWCESPRVKVCTMDYEPVCGNLSSGRKADYSSPCNACADNTVASYSLGSCQEQLE